MSYLLSLLFLLPVAQKKADPAPPDIVLPPSPQPPKPPQPEPGQTVNLGSKQYYVVQSNVPVVIVASPDGILRVRKKPGTITVCGDLYGYPDDCVDFAAKDSVYVVSGIHMGRAELIIVNGQTVVRQPITVTDAPPGPGPTPSPLTQTLQTAYAADADTDKANSLAFLQAQFKNMATMAPAAAVTLKLVDNADFALWMKTLVDREPTTNPNGLTPTQVRGLRTAVGLELASAWGKTKAPLAAKDAAAEFQKISDALAGVK